MKNIVLVLVWCAVFLMAGCAAMRADEPGKDGAPAMVNRFVDAHTEILSRLDQIGGDEKRLGADSQKILEVAQRSLRILEEMSDRYGAGEVTLFFPINSSALERAEYERLISFADYLSRESQGRKVIFVSIGSASSIGNYKSNLKLARSRSEVPKSILDKYLINIPHEFYSVYGTGDVYSPKNVRMNESLRYQHVRIIAVFDPGRLPQNMNPPVKR